MNTFQCPHCKQTLTLMKAEPTGSPAIPKPAAADTGTCRDCGQEIFWQTARSGKKYPTNSEVRNDFHRCKGGL